MLRTMYQRGLCVGSMEDRNLSACHDGTAPSDQRGARAGAAAQHAILLPEAYCTVAYITAVYHRLHLDLEK
jgi:hypothetical protein